MSFKVSSIDKLCESMMGMSIRNKSVKPCTAASTYSYAYCPMCETKIKVAKIQPYDIEIVNKNEAIYKYRYRTFCDNNHQHCFEGEITVKTPNNNPNKKLISVTTNHPDWSQLTNKKVECTSYSPKTRIKQTFTKNM